MSMPQPVIADLQFDEVLEDKLVEEHGVDVDDIYDLIESNDWIRIRNKRTHPPEHQRFVGRLSNGRLLTAILKETDQSGVWRIISVWLSGPEEAAMYKKGRPHRNA